MSLRITVSEMDVMEPADIIERVRRANVVGMGGGGFPAAEKLDTARRRGIDTVIGNAMATEPNSLGDAHVLRYEHERVLAGLNYVRAATGAVTAFVASSNDDDLPNVRAIDAPFPAGEERRLVAAATGRVVADYERPTDVGVVVFNVATLAAIADAVEGRALDGRYLGLGGEARYVRYGTPLGSFDLGAKIRVGGFSGFTAAPDEVVKPTTISLGGAHEALDCIRCGWCAPRCPVAPRPDALHEHYVRAETVPAAIECIECGACNAACPSHIDLVNEFRVMKAQHRKNEAREEDAQKAKARVAQRDARLARRQEIEQSERRSRRSKRRAAPRSWQSGADKPPSPTDSSASS